MLRRKSPEQRMQAEYSPEQWKQVASSPAALAAIKQALCTFKHNQKKQTLQTSFIPATMSELMSNLVVNLKRKENLETFDSEA